MKTLEKLPASFQRRWEGECYCCTTKKCETITYEIQIEMLDHYNQFNKKRRTYRIYYKPRYYVQFKRNPEVIGCATGMGCSRVSEIVEKLLKLINNPSSIERE